VNGVFCISLDFEKYWGVRDVVKPGQIENRFLKIEQVVVDTLRIFQTHGVHASWATVGLLNHPSLEALMASDQRMIHYSNSAYSPFPFDRQVLSTIPWPILNGQREINEIVNTPGQELASHTYSHFYTMEKGQTSEDFSWDVTQMDQLAGKIGRHFSSIVFPRNQVNQEYLQILQKSGYKAFRGNQLNSDWENSTFGQEGVNRKIRRVADAYFEVSQTKSFSLATLPSSHGLVNIPASRFLRPCKHTNWLEKRKINRIKIELRKAAQNGTIYHLWWHPHNLTHQPEQAIEQIAELCAYAVSLKREFGLEFMNMSEIATYVKP